VQASIQRLSKIKIATYKMFFIISIVALKYCGDSRSFRIRLFFVSGLILSPLILAGIIEKKESSAPDVRARIISKTKLVIRIVIVCPSIESELNRAFKVNRY
jgi:hypothetical protein